MPDAFETYLAGVPLNEDLAALRDGRSLPEPAVESPGWKAQEPTEWELEKPLTRGDLADLREFRNHPGFALFIRLQKLALRKHEQQAILKSKQAPLLQKDEVAQEWALLSMYERALKEQTALIDAMIAELERDGDR